MELEPGKIIFGNTPMAPKSKDPWIRSEGMLCKTCMYYVPKLTAFPVPQTGRCRRHAPALNGYPVVFPNDWCGDHKLDENKVNP